ncbi:hypothetical protein D9M72_338990 [compost metagenome]
MPGLEAHAQPLADGCRCRVQRIQLGVDPVEVQALKAEPKHRLGRFGGVAVAARSWGQAPAHLGLPEARQPFEHHLADQPGRVRGLDGQRHPVALLVEHKIGVLAHPFHALRVALGLPWQEPRGAGQRVVGIEGVKVRGFEAAQDQAFGADGQSDVRHGLSVPSCNSPGLRGAATHLPQPREPGSPGPEAPKGSALNSALTALHVGHGLALARSIDRMAGLYSLRSDEVAAFMVRQRAFRIGSVTMKAAARTPKGRRYSSSGPNTRKRTSAD